MGFLATAGGVVMAIAAISLAALAVDSALRNGGEGVLIGLGLAAAAILPAGVAASLFGSSFGVIAYWAAWYAAAIAACLMVFGAVLLVHGEQGGIVCIGLSLVMGALIYAVAPGLVASATLPAPARPAVRG